MKFNGIFIPLRENLFLFYVYVLLSGLISTTYGRRGIGDLMEERTGSTPPFAAVDLIDQGVALNTPETEFEFSDGLTEIAILSWADLKLNMDMEKMKKNCAILQVEAFNSQKKRRGVLIRKNIDDADHVHWKGAAEMILCAQAIMMFLEW
ncbi:hypothetical protein PTKIN_Ptkin08bG0021600 [Pterospermum kingtungense]